jgi:microcystin-dependent protein
MKKLFASIAFLLSLSIFSQNCMIGEVKMFAGNFAPRNWALLNGQLLPISQNSALFSILGTQFGGNGRTTFALPDMRGRSPIHAGQGPGLSQVRVGQKVGIEKVTLSPSQMPAGMGGIANFVGLAYDGQEVRVMPQRGNRGVAIPLAIETNVQANVNLGGSNQTVENRQPSLTINHIICLQGIYPSRS